jgi:DNA (cytosine-5)-methyltransferase 1
MLMPNIFTEPTFLVIDLFCGAGGVSTGFVMTKGIALVIACVNHDHTAILSHKCNHPDTHHFEEDIRVLDLAPLKAILEKYKKMYPRAKTVLWGSLECQGVSKAAGGRAKEEKSRTLYQVFYERYVKELQTDYVKIENVVEFEFLGPTRIRTERVWHNEYGGEVWDLCVILNKHKERIFGVEPIPERKGEYFREFNEAVMSEGYEMEWERMNAADYGAYTSRLRLFGCFKRPGLPNAWPAKTHHKTGANGLKKWNAVKEKLDLKDEGISIFHRSQNMTIPKRQRKDIGDNSMIRYYEGCIKHIAGGRERFEAFVRANYPEMVETHCKLKPGRRKSKKATAEEPAETESAFISKYYSGNPESRNISVNGPLSTIPTENRFSINQIQFLGTYHGNGDNTHSLHNPGPTLPCNDSVYIINTQFIDKYYSGPHNNSSLQEPLGTILNTPKSALLTAKQGQFSFIDSTNFTNVPSSGDEPLPAITASRHWPYILNPSHGGHTHDIGEACPTIVASQHKAPLYLVMVEEGKFAIRIFETDSKAVVMLKQFMAMYGIIDIKMRMLRVDELLRIQGFPNDYVLAGSQEEQKKHIGNSVEPNQVTCWCIAIHNEIQKLHAA